MPPTRSDSDRKERSSRRRSRNLRRSRSRSLRRSRSRQRSRVHREDEHDHRSRDRFIAGSRHDERSEQSVSASSADFNGFSSHETDFSKLANLLSGICATGSRRSGYINEKILPKFDPEAKHFSAKEGIERVNTCGEMYDWDEKTKLYLAILKLEGNAKLWYDGLSHALLTWDVFSISIIRQFPGEESFGKLMRDAVLYESTPGQDLQTYCFTKLGKINKLKLDLKEENIVDMIAQGIHDQSIRKVILTTRIKKVSDLSERLSIFHGSDDSKESRNSKDNKHATFNSAAPSRKKKISTDKSCFHCGQQGHFIRSCPEKNEAIDNKKSKTDVVENMITEKKVEAKICSFCGAQGHLEERCFKKMKKDKTKKKE